MAEYRFGEIAGHPVGTTYDSRVEAALAGVHQVNVQGIAGNRDVGCVSIALNGGYDTDEDYGHEIFYTGAGGQDPNNRKVHIAHQELDYRDNAALLRSEQTSEPIRILRGWKGEPAHSPAHGYRYDGLYKVTKHYPLYPADGWRRWMFHLVQLTPGEAAKYARFENREANARAFSEHGLGSGEQAPTPGAAQPSAGKVDPFYEKPITYEIPAGNHDPGTKVSIQERIIRDTKVTATVKAMYGDICQICGVRVATAKGHYSEGAHIRPLGKPHRGPDTMANILCLCPNHHAAFDKGGIYIDDDLNAHDHTGQSLGALDVHDDHAIDLNNIRYHRAHHAHGIAAVEA